MFRHPLLLLHLPPSSFGPSSSKFVGVDNNYNFPTCYLYQVFYFVEFSKGRKIHLKVINICWVPIVLILLSLLLNQRHVFSDKGQVKAPPEFNQALTELMAKIRRGEPLVQRRQTERSVSVVRLLTCDKPKQYYMYVHVRVHVHMYVDFVQCSFNLIAQ